VLFFVDGNKWWVDTAPPYSFGPPGSYFPTRWLSTVGTQWPPSVRGPTSTHKFEVRLVTTSHAKASATVRLQGSVGPEASLASFGEYGRLSPADIANPPPPGKYPPYAAWLNFIGATLFVREGSQADGFAWEISSDKSRIYIGTPIFLGIADHVAGFAGFIVSRTFCALPMGPPPSTRGRS
jgi:hypothetical protein